MCRSGKDAGSGNGVVIVLVMLGVVMVLLWWIGSKWGCLRSNGETSTANCVIVVKRLGVAMVLLFWQTGFER